MQWKERQGGNFDNLTMISIGTPKNLKALIQHLELPEEFPLYVDPENTLYDALDLRRGVQRTFFNPATPFSFLRRIQDGDLGTLGTVLSKWNRGT